MRKLSLLAPALLAACTTAPAATPVHGVTRGHKCDASKAAGFIGRAGSKAAAAPIKRASHAAVLRWAPPGVMLTMDYREDRVTVYLDADRKVTKITCG